MRLSINEDPMAEAKLQMHDRQVADVRVIELRGALDGHTFSQLEKHVEAIDHLDGMRMVLILEAIHFISSAGVGVIISLMQKIRDRQGNLQICRPSQQVRDVFDVLGLNRLVTVRDSVEDAIAAARK